MIDTASKKVQINQIVRSQLPSFVQEESPLFIDFLKQYYLAQEYQGKEPNIGKLKQEVENIKETYDLQKNKKDKELEEYKKAVEQKKHILVVNLEGVVDWYNKKFNKELKADLENVSEIISILQDKGHNLTTDNAFENLTKRQSKLESARDRLLSNLKIVIYPEK